AVKGGLHLHITCARLIGPEVKRTLRCRCLCNPFSASHRSRLAKEGEVIDRNTERAAWALSRASGKIFGAKREPMRAYGGRLAWSLTTDRLTATWQLSCLAELTAFPSCGTQYHR